MYVLIAFLTPILHALSCIVDAHFSNNIFKKVPSLVFYAISRTPLNKKTPVIS